MGKGVPDIPESIGNKYGFTKHDSTQENVG